MSNTPKTLTTEEAQKILDHFNSCMTCPSGVVTCTRNLLMVLLMLDSGLRVGELVQLHIADLVRSRSPVPTLMVRREITKTQMPRMIPLTARIQKATTSMYELNWKVWKEPETCYAFFNTSPDYFLTVRQVQRIVGTVCEKAIGRWINPHILRHTFGTNVNRTSGMRVAQELLGHKSITSTQVYTHPNGNDLKGAIDQLESDSH